MKSGEAHNIPSLLPRSCVLSQAGSSQKSGWIRKIQESCLSQHDMARVKSQAIGSDTMSIKTSSKQFKSKQQRIAQRNKEVGLEMMVVPWVQGQEGSARLGSV